MAEQYLAHAVDMKWVIVDGDKIAPGAINPAPRDDGRGDLSQAGGRG